MWRAWQVGGVAAPAGAGFIMMLDRWLTPPAILRQAFCLGACSGMVYSQVERLQGVGRGVRKVRMWCLWGGSRVRSLACPGVFGGGLVGAVRAQERAVILTAVQSIRLLIRRGLWGDKRRDAASTFGLVGRWRVGALCARERAVILTAVQSLRLLIRRGLWGDKRDAASTFGLVGRWLAGALCARERAVTLTADQGLLLAGSAGLFGGVWLGEVGLVGDFFGDWGWEKEIAGGG